MTYENAPIVAFNRGLISDHGIARTDIKRTAFSAEIQDNMLPKVLGSMMLRPGMEYTANTKDNKKSLTIPFIYDIDVSTDMARIELTENVMRVLVDDTPISRASVSTAISNPNFNAYVTNGSFSASTDWTLGSGWAIATGAAAATSASSAISQNSAVTLVNGKQYSITYTITRSAGTIAPSIGGTSGTARSSSGTYTETIVAGASQVIALTGSSFTGTVDDVSVDPIDTGWYFVNGTTVDSDAGSLFTNALPLQQGKSYEISYDITHTGGNVTPVVGGTSGTAVTLAGSHSETIVAGATSDLGFSTSNFSGTIENVSITPLDTGSGSPSTVSRLGDDGLILIGTGFDSAGRGQHITISSGDQNVEHAINIVIERGTVTFQVGSTESGDDYISPIDLGSGTHSMTFTPTGGDAYLRFTSLSLAKSIVTSCDIEAAGSLELATPWYESDLPYIRTDSSGNTVYVSCRGYFARKLIWHGGTSWSIEDYRPVDGPFRNINTTVTSLTPSGTTGDITLAASRNLFDPLHVGALFRLTSIGQNVSGTFTGEDQFTDPIKITGSKAQRNFYVTISGTWSGTITKQYSVGAPGAWIDYTTHTSNITNQTTNDGFDGSDIYFRVGFKGGDYTSGTAQVSMTYSSGGLDGIVEITGVTDEKNATASVLSPLGSTAGTTTWYEGEWSDYRGYPTALVLHDGRMFHIGKGKIWGSVSDAFDSFDDTIVGDSGPINRSFGKGPVDRAVWALSLQRLCVGGALKEWSSRSSSFDAPLTPSDFVTRSPSSQGSSNVSAIDIDGRGLFVGKDGITLYQMDFTNPAASLDYATENLCEFIPEIGLPGFVKIAVQRKPDTRVHGVRADGSVAILVSQPAEEVMCWVTVSTPGASGFVEDVTIMPGNVEDRVYYTVRRTVNGETVRYHEKWSLVSECQGGTLNKQADSFITYSGAATNVISGLDHLIGEDVVIWGDGKDLGTATVAGDGTVTIPNSNTAENAVIGLSYVGKFKSAKLAYAAMQGTALEMKKRVDHLGVILRNTHYQGLKYGPSFEELENLPLVGDVGEYAEDTIHNVFDMDQFEFNGEWNTDSRLCLQATAPRPCTVLGAIVGVSTNG